VIWLFRAFAAATQNNDTKGSFWHFSDTEGRCNFTVAPQTQGKIKNAPSEWLRGPNRNKVLSEQIRADPDPPSESIAAEVPATVHDSTQGSQTEANQGDTNGQGNAGGIQGQVRERSPGREQRPGAGSLGEQSLPTGDPKQIFLQDYPGWKDLESSGFPRIRRLWLQNLCHGHLQLSGKGTK